MRKITVVPFLCMLSTSIWPLWASIIDLVINKPSPVPGGDVTHTGITILLHQGRNGAVPRAYFTLAWEGRGNMRGGGAMGTSVGSAPRLALYGTHPLTVTMRGGRLVIGRVGNLSFFFGNIARGGGPLICVLHNMSEGGNTFTVTLTGRDADGEAVSRDYPLTTFC